MSGLTEKTCFPCEGDVSPFDAEQAKTLLAQLNDWSLDPESKTLQQDFRFKDFHQTMAFVNAVAWIAHQQDHHPDLEVGYNHCQVHYTTHTIDGLSENDFICAAKIDALLHNS